MPSFTVAHRSSSILTKNQKVTPVSGPGKERRLADEQAASLIPSTLPVQMSQFPRWA
jgi:hypothetical protein